MTWAVIKGRDERMHVTPQRDGAGAHAADVEGFAPQVEGLVEDLTFAAQTLGNSAGRSEGSETAKEPPKTPPAVQQPETPHANPAPPQAGQTIVQATLDPHKPTLSETVGVELGAAAIMNVPLAEFSGVQVTSYTELMGGIQAQVEALGLKLTDFDDLAGFPSGLSGKVFGMLQVKRLGPEKVFDALRAAGLRLRIEVDPEQQAKMKARISENYNPRNAKQARKSNAASPAGPAVLSRIFKPLAKMGGKARMAKMTPEELRQHQKKAAMAGVLKRRKEQKRRARQRKANHKARKGSS